MAEEINAYRDLVGKAQGKRWLGWRERRWEENIKMGVKDIEQSDLTVFILPGIGINGGLLWTRQWTSVFQIFSLEIFA
jgi:hypothetical protein